MPNTTTQAIILKDFSGGLWLNEGEPPNNTFATFIENLDPLFGGGVQKREPIRLDMKPAIPNGEELWWYPYLSGPMTPWLQADPTNGQRYTMIDWFGNTPANYKLKCYTQGTAAATWSAVAGNNPTSFDFASSDAVAGGAWYVHNANNDIKRVTTAGVSTGLTATFNDNISAPANGQMPRSYVGTQHLAAYYFVGSTIEGGTTFPNRLRWSHPGRFEDYRTNDKQDIGDFSAIIGLYSVNESLLIVKETQVWVMTGFDPDTFQFHKIADNAYAPPDGTAPRTAGCSQAQHGAFVAINGAGIFHWDGKTWSEISDGLKDAIVDGRVQILHMAVVGGVLYCSSGGGLVNSDGAGDSTSDLSWEYNLILKSWTQHKATFRGLASIRPTLAGVPKGYALYQHGNAAGYSFAFYRQHIAAGSWCDNWTGSNVDIVCQWRSPWQDAKNPARKKRWRRPWFVFNKRPNASASDPVNYTLTIFKDWDGVHPTKTSTFAATKAVDTTDYNSTFGYGHATTGSDYDEGGAFSAPGSGYAMQVLISSTGTPKDQWGFDSLTFKFVPRSLR